MARTQDLMEVSTSPPQATRENRLLDLIERHQGPIWRYLRFLGADEELAADLAQETFLAVWRRPPEDRGDAASRAYLRKVARNLFLMQVRRQRARPRLVDLREAEEVWQRHEWDDGEIYREALSRCLDELGERPREAIQLFYGQVHSRQEVADALGMATEGVKTLLRRTRERLRDCIERKVNS